MKQIGKPPNKIYSKLNYKLRKDGRKYSVFCLYCRKVLKNIAKERLRGHRTICPKEDDIQINQFLNQEQVLTEEIVIKPEIADYKEIEYSDSSAAVPSETQSITKEPEILSTNAFVQLHSVENGANKEEGPPVAFHSPEEFPQQHLWQMSQAKETEPEPYHLRSNSLADTFENISTIAKSKCCTSTNIDQGIRKPSKLNGRRKYKIKKKYDIFPFKNMFPQTILADDKERLDQSLAKFLYGCDIPLSVIESQHFINFIHQIRPDYVNQIPMIKDLSTSLLESEYRKQIENGKRCVENESILLLDSRKTSGNDALDIIGILKNSQGEHIFLDVWNGSVNLDIESFLPNITEKFLLRAREVYSTTIYVVVSRYESTLINFENKNVWHSICHLHIANLLVKDLTNKNLVDGVKLILNLLHQSDFENEFLRKGGSKITNFNEESYFSQRDIFLWFLRNLFYIRDVAINPESKIFHDQIKDLIFSSNFVGSIKKSIDLLEPIYDIIDKAQNATFSIADAANLWLSLEPSTEYKNLTELFNKRKSIALNTYTLSAYYLNPFYSNDKLTADQLEMIENFLQRHLDAEGLAELDLYKRYQGFFNILTTNFRHNANIFWRMALMKHPKISKLALSLLNIPASVGSIQTIKSSLSYSYSKSLSDLTFEQSKKLNHIYYSLNVNDSNKKKENV